MLEVYNLLHIFRCKLFVGFVACVALSACDTESFTNEAGELPEVEIIDFAHGTLRSQRTVANVIPIGLTQGEGTIVDRIYFQSSQPNGQTETYRVVFDPELVTTYNETNGTDFDMLPATNAELEGDGILSIESGEFRSQALKINFSAAGLDPGTYLLPVKVDGSFDERQCLYYGVIVRKLDLIDNPLDTDFLTVFYLNTDEYQPLLADIFAIEKSFGLEIIWKRTIGNIVNLRVVQIGYDEPTDAAKLLLNSNIRYVLENADKYIRPLQDKGRKVCLSIEGAGTGLGFCNLSEQQMADFVAQVKNVVETYRLDGINLWDRNSGYGKDGMPAMNTTSYPRLIKALREALGEDKLLTVTDHMEPTAYFWDTTATGGIAVGEYIDYAWSGYMSEDEDVQLLDPWLDPNEAAGMGIMLLERKPFAGLDPTRYGNFAMPWYNTNSPYIVEMLGLQNLMMWRMFGYMKSRIVVYGDLITRLQNQYEMSLSTIIPSLYLCITDDMFDFEAGEIIYSYNFSATDNELGGGHIGTWGYNYLMKDW